MLSKNVCIKRKIKNVWDFPGGALLRLHASNAADVGSILAREQHSYMLWSKAKKEKKMYVSINWRSGTIENCVLGQLTARFLMHCTTLSSMVGKEG